MLHGAGPAASTEKIIPVTCVQVKRSAAPVIGLVPTSPVTAEAGTSVIPDFVSITKLPADLRLTGAGPGPAANALPAIARSAIPAIYVFFIILITVRLRLTHAMSTVAQSIIGLWERARRLRQYGPGDYEVVAQASWPVVARTSPSALQTQVQFISPALAGFSTMYRMARLSSSPLRIRRS